MPHAACSQAAEVWSKCDFVKKLIVYLGSSLLKTGPGEAVKV